MNAAGQFASLFVFPGVAFLVGYAFALEYVDRKIIARIQRRVGPGPTQPVADFLKLLTKENTVPEKAHRRIFNLAPLIGFAGVVTAVLYVPTWSYEPVVSFRGDLVVVLFLLAFPSFGLFLGGWYSRNVFGQVGTLRTLTVLFGYEIPFFLACLAPAVAAGSWTVAEITAFHAANPWLLALQVVAFGIGLLSLAAKLERVPFDVPEAETEIAGGPIADYSGRKLAMFHLTRDVEMVVGAALLSALFLGGVAPFGGVEGVPGAALGFATFVAKTVGIVFLLGVLQSSFARFRVEQLMSMFYKWLVTLGVAQLVVVLAAVELVGGV